MATYYFFDDDDNVPFRYLTPTQWLCLLPLPYDTPLTARQYLEFASRDMEEGTDRGLINAFGNVKKALHLTIDTTLNQYGLLVHANAKRLPFPQRLRLLDAIGVLPTFIIQNLNVERNFVEHDYVVPEQRRVKEAVDVTQLLQLALQSQEHIPSECVVGWNEPKRHAVMRLEAGVGQLQLFSLKAPGMYQVMRGVRCVKVPLKQRMMGLLGSEPTTPGVTVSRKPFHCIELTQANSAEWKPILEVLLEIAQGRSTNVSTADVIFDLDVTPPTSTPA